MKNIKLFLAMIMAVAAFGFMGPVYASHTQVALTSDDNLTIRRTVTDVSNPVTNTFGYTITQGETVEASSNTPATNPAGGVTGFPTGANAATVVFNGVAPTDGTATSTGTVDLSGVTFTKVGNYTWTITETSSTDATNFPLDSTNTYTVKVSVRYDNNQDMVATVVVADKDDNKLDDVEGNDSKLLFTSAPKYTNITIGKTVSGNMADQQEYFKVNVTINGTTGDSYNVSGLDASGKYNGGDFTNPTTIPAGTATAVYLKHGQTVKIGAGSDGTSANEIPLGLTYTFVEDNAGNAANYVTTIDGSAAGVDKKDSGNLTTATTNEHAIVNSYNSNTLTGILLTIMPYIIIVAIAIAGIAYLVVKNKKNQVAQAE